MFWDNIKQRNNSDFKRLTGVKRMTFKLMVREIKNHERKRVLKRGNKRSRPYKLSVEDRILMMLMYYREYRTQYHIGETYGITESNVSRNIREIETILKKAKKFQLQGKKRLSEQSHKYEVYIIDATESPIERPKKNSIGTTPAKKRSIQ
jgi:hypothetical protein